MLITNKDVGLLMVAVGGVLEAKSTNHILLVQRAQSLDWHPDDWEVVYGRINQNDTPDQGLRREFFEELGFNTFQQFEALRVWHTYRGEKENDNEMVGITYRLSCENEFIPNLSSEHQNFIWTTPKHALELCTVEGIQKDIQSFLNSKEFTC